MKEERERQKALVREQKRLQKVELHGWSVTDR